MMPFVLYLAIPFLLFFLLFKLQNTRKKLLPPGPPGLPIIGNLHQLDTSAPHRYLWQLSLKYGPIMSLRLGRVPTVVFSSARMAEQVLKTHDLVFANRPLMVGPKRISYNATELVFQPLNDYRRELGKICALHLFSAKKVQSFCSIREDEVSLMIKKISKLARDSEVINLSEILMALTSSIICRIAFGKRYEDEGHERSRFHSLLHGAQAMLANFFLTDYVPLLGWVDKVNGSRRRLEKIFKELDSFYQEIIEEHLDPNEQKPEQEDLVDVLLRLRNERSFTVDFTWDHIKAVLTDVFIAGTDTSAAATVWAMTALIKKPEVMRKAQYEVREFVGKKGFLNEEDLPKLPFLKAVVKETMRLYPPAPLLLPRETTETCVIDGYEIPAKTLAFVNAWAVGRDPEAWVNPEEFLPERFLGNSVDFRGQDYKLVPFGAGRRICPGIYMGIVTMELALANLLYSFEWKLPDGMKKESIDTNVLPGITMHKKTPLCLVARGY